MNTNHLIEQIHEVNARCRRKERRQPRRVAWRIAIPAAAAAILLVILFPRNNEVKAAMPAPGIYCNSQCNPDDVMALIDNNINHIKELQRI